MENAYIYNLCMFFLMTVIVTYVWNKHENKGILEKREFLKIILLAPFLISISFFIGRFFEGNLLKFILTIGPTALLWLYLVIEPNAFKKYDPIVKKYGGLLMAVFLAFIITGCSSTPRQEISPTQQQEKINIEKRILNSNGPNLEESKKQGHGAVR